MRRAWLGATFACCAFIGAGLGCSLTTSLDGYSVRDDVADAADAGDGSGNTPPGNSDAGDAAPPSLFCSAMSVQPTLCVDFEDGKVPSALALIAQLGGSVTVEREGLGASYGATVAIASQGDGSGGACMRFTMKSGVTHVAVEADVRLAAAGVVDFDVLTVHSTTGNELGIHLVGVALEYEEDSSRGQTLAPANRSLDNQFHRLRITFDGTATGVHSELFVDGTFAVAHETEPALLGGTATVEFGDCTIGSSRSWRVHFDDLVVDAK